jgi:murein DD-endopeptidase MepM/ murein hydrolase activator NlpD
MLTPPQFSARTRVVLAAGLSVAVALGAGRSSTAWGLAPGVAPIVASPTAFSPASTAGSAAGSAAPASPTHSWRWPVSQVGVVRDYVAPVTEFAAGHRGVDLRASVGDEVLAAHDGVVSFVGEVADTRVVTVAHAGGWLSSYLPVDASVAAGDRVSAGAPLGRLAADSSHCSCLHFGLRYGGRYLSPKLVLGGIPRAVLLPW